MKAHRTEFICKMHMYDLAHFFYSLFPLAAACFFLSRPNLYIFLVLFLVALSEKKLVKYSYEKMVLYLCHLIQFKCFF